MLETETTRPQLVSSKFLCDRYGVVRSTLHDWAKKQPNLKAPNGEFILSECDLYFIESLKLKANTTKVNTKDRLIIAQASKIELETKIREFDLLEKIAKVEAEKQKVEDRKIASDARTELLELLKFDTDKLGIVLAPMTDPLLIKERIDRYLTAMEEHDCDNELDYDDEFEETSNLVLGFMSRK
jgi:hypothetical protein